MPDDTLTFLVNTFRKVADSQHALAAEWTAGGNLTRHDLAAVDYVRGYAAAFTKAAEIVAEQLPRTDKES